MFKKLLSILVLTTVSFFSNAYTLSYVGTIEAKKYNDVWEQYFDADIIVYAGSNGQTSNIRLVFDMSFDKYNYDFVFNGVDPSVFSEYQTFLKHLTKASDWAKIAQDNNANTSKDIGSCNVEGTKCKVSFQSSNRGKNIVTKIWIKEDEDFTFNEDTFRLTPKQVNQLLKWFDDASMAERLELSAIENNQSDELFN